MSMRAIVVVVILAVAILGYVAWDQNAARAPAGGAPSSEPAPTNVPPVYEFVPASVSELLPVFVSEPLPDIDPA